MSREVTEGFILDDSRVSVERGDDMELVVFVGLQASGKSTFYRSHFAATHVHVSKDLFPNARNKAARQAREIKAALQAGRDVVVDNTSASPEERRAILEVAARFDVRLIAYFFESTFDACMERNALREDDARVPDVGLKATAKKLRAPTHAEGFHTVYFVSGPIDNRSVKEQPHEV
jgi:predicted kinase